jgi:5,10-methylenetetrahydromethanopterin reductase
MSHWHIPSNPRTRLISKTTRAHLMFVMPEERPYVTAGLIRATLFTATESEIKRRIDALRGAGYTQFTNLIVPGQEEAIADWARIRQAFA